MRIFLGIGLCITLAACSGGGSSGSAGSVSSLNPFNWFQGNRSTQSNVKSLAPRRGYGFVVDTRPLVDQITGVSIDKTATGAIIRVTALTPAQGFHSAGLIIVGPQQTGQVTLQFRARPPVSPTAVGPVHLRELVVGKSLSRAQLLGIRRINIIAQRNSRTVRP
ncbi:MAG: hypothetical protein V3V25_08345 [Paracoccaceae bacterium]